MIIIQYAGDSIRISVFSETIAGVERNLHACFTDMYTGCTCLKEFNASEPVQVSILFCLILPKTAV